ncbi:MAG: glycosyltransferase family 4 protein [Candidatus Promineifilaceae bacterium]
MRILYLSQVVPYPADAGPKIRIYHVLQYLHQQGHEITLAAFRRERDRPEDIAHLQRYCQAIHTVLMRRSKLADGGRLALSLVSGASFLIGRDSVSAMRRLVTRLLSQGAFDAVHADQLAMAQYALPAGADNSARPMTVLDQHNAVYMIPQRIAAGSRNPLKRALLRLESRRLARYEVEVCGRFGRVVWVTAEDRQAIRAAANGAGAQIGGPVIPICVDTQRQRPIPRGPQPFRVTFLGGLHWPPNAAGVAWFAREVWPQVRSQAPQAVLTVIGQQPPPDLTGDDAPAGLEATGYVADPRPYLAETAAFIVPLHAGGGMRVKILDAWAWGLPVVATPIGAEGIRYQAGHDLLIAATVGDFAQAVTGLLQRPEAAAALAENGRRSVEEHYDWRRVYPAWDQIYPRPQASA